MVEELEWGEFGGHHVWCSKPRVTVDGLNSYSTENREVYTKSRNILGVEITNRTDFLKALNSENEEVQDDTSFLMQTSGWIVTAFV